MSTKNEKNETPSDESVELSKPTCGIVMPISEIDGCSSSHWKDVLNVIEEAAELAGYEAKLVSQSDDVGVIQQRIVQNLYDSEIVVCDVSAKNANVMFELGLRLAFDKPAIVLKDDKTSYSFDTSPIEHLEYPRDLRYSTIQQFKKDLSGKIKATVEASKSPEYTTFLKHFGKFEVAALETKQVTETEFIQQELREMKHSIAQVSQSVGLLRAKADIAPIRSRRSSLPIRASIRELLDEGKLSSHELRPGSVAAYHLLSDEHFSKYDSPEAFEKAVDRAIVDISGEMGF